jgi:hypothetical protein
LRFLFDNANFKQICAVGKKESRKTPEIKKPKEEDAKLGFPKIFKKV